MKIGYNYKLQWLFQVREQLFTSERSLRKQLYSFIQIVEGQNLTVVYFRDSSYNIIKKHTLKNSNIYGEEFATTKLIQYIKKTLEKDSRIYSVELIRK